MEEQEIYRILEEAYFSEHPHEEGVLARLRDILPGIHHFVDAGASLGQFTFLASQCMRGGRIDAIEADTVRFEKLAQNCGLWGRDGRNQIVAHHLALTSTPGDVTFFSTGSNVSGGLMAHPLDHLDVETRSKVTWNKLQIRGATLDSLFGDAPPDLIKMDIEGAELSALIGSERLLNAKKTRFLIELHDFNHDGTPQKVFELMRSRGYLDSSFEDKTFFEPETLRTRFARKVHRLRSKALGI